jgi:acyl-CoA hydrolase
MRGLINTIREMNLVKEDGHVDVSSSIRKCKTAVEDASQIMSKLQTMDPEGSLPTWWTNKLAIASMSFNKMRDYLLVSGEQKEEVDLSEREKEIDKLPRQFLNPDKEEMIIKKNKVIVINKKDLDKYLKKGWELAEKLDDKDEPTVKDVVKLLKKASQAHAGQAKDLEKAVND